MIVECEQCKSQFRLDADLLKTEGVKVRCSQCKHVFTAYPVEKAPVDEPGPDEYTEDALAETVSLDSPPVLREELASKDEGHEDFDRAFAEAMSEETVRTISPDQIPDEEEEEEERPESFDMSEVIGRAVTIEEELIKEDAERKVSEIPPKRAGEKTAEAAPPKKKRRRPRLFPVILGIIVLLVAGGLAVFFLAPDLIPDSLSMFKPPQKQEITDVGVRRLAFKAVAGSFVETQSAGQLFVIRGMVTNNYPKARSFILVKGAILDDQGRIVKRNMSYAGNTLTDQQLQNMTVEQINKELKNRSGKENMNVNIKSGASIPIMIAFSGLPDNLSEFTVEAVSSSPGR